MRLNVSSFALLSSAAMAIPSFAYAQETPTPAEQKVPSANSDSDIVVTARKREENIRDVPVSITALSPVQLTQAKITQIGDLSARVPNLSVSAVGILPYSLIRGFGSGSNASFEQSVGKFVDNVSYGRDQDLRLPLFDVERVEVLRGPQVLLYGNSATAGALNISTKKPGDALAADFSVGYNFNYNEVTSQAGVTLPIMENLSLRVSGIYQNREKGITFNTLTGRSEPPLRAYGTRAILRATPTNRLTLTLKAEYDRTREEGNVSELISPPVFGILGPRFADTTLDGRKAQNSLGAPFFQPEFTEVRNKTYQGDIAYDLGGGTLNSTTAYRVESYAQSFSVATPVPLLSAFSTFEYKQFSQELRYANSIGPVDFMVGGYYQRDTLDILTAIGFNISPTIPGNPPIPAFALDARLDQLQKSYSGFADFTYHLTDSLSVEAGGRYTWVRKDADQFTVPGALVFNKTFASRRNALAPSPAFEALFRQAQGVPSHSFADLKYRDEFFQPQVVLQYRPSSTDQVFARYVKGTKAGGFDYFYSGFAPIGPVRDDVQFAAERAQTLEVGAKGLLFDNVVDYSVILFRETFKDLQASQFTGVNFVVSNVGKARSEGIEVDLGFRPASGLRFGFSGTYLDAKYIDFPGQPCTIAQQVAAGSPTGCSQDLSGTPTLLSSKWTGVFTADYRWSLSSDLEMALGGAVLARSKYNASNSRDPLGEQSGFAKVDAHIDLRSANGHYTASIYGKNLTDKRTLEYVNPATGAGGALQGYPSLGREIGLRFGFNY